MRDACEKGPHAFSQNTWKTHEKHMKTTWRLHDSAGSSSRVFMWFFTCKIVDSHATAIKVTWINIWKTLHPLVIWAAAACVPRVNFSRIATPSNVQRCTLKTGTLGIILVKNTPNRGAILSKYWEKSVEYHKKIIWAKILRWEMHLPPWAKHLRFSSNSLAKNAGEVSNHSHATSFTWKHLWKHLHYPSHASAACEITSHIFRVYESRRSMISGCP